MAKSVVTQASDLLMLFMQLKIKGSDITSLSVSKHERQPRCLVSLECLLKVSRSLNVPRKNVNISEEPQYTYVHVSFVAGGVEWTSLISRPERDEILAKLSADHAAIESISTRRLNHEPQKLTLISTESGS